MIKSPFRKNTAADRFCIISNVDWLTGYSEIVPIEILNKYNLSLGNGGSWCRSDGPLGNIFNVTRIKDKGSIIAVKLDGFNKTKKSQIISHEIKKYFKDNKCIILNIGGKFIEIDHKDGRKDNLLVDINQCNDDFQPMHKTVNIAKRDHCKKCIQTNIRFDARLLGYYYAQWIGPIEYKGSCIGCYWFDPYKFNSEISKNYKKKM